MDLHASALLVPLPGQPAFAVEAPGEPVPARLPLRSFRSSGPIRAESFDLVEPALLSPPDTPIRGFSRGDAGIVLDRELCGLAAADARCRLVQARIVERVIALRAWRALGFVRLGDFARERLGVSPRSLEEDARVVKALVGLPGMLAALESGEISWTRARVLVRIATAANEGLLLEQSRAVPMRELDKWARAFPAASGIPNETVPADDSRSSNGDSATGEWTPLPWSRQDARSAQGASAVDAPVVDDDPLVRWSIDLSRTGRRLWRTASEYASRGAGSALSPGQVLELVVAEAASGLPSASVRDQSLLTWVTPPGLHERRLRNGIRARAAKGERSLLGFLAECGVAEGFAWLDPATRDPGPAASVDALQRDLEYADAFELERRLQQLRLFTQRLEGQMAALLRTGVDRRLFREIGFASVKLYAEARLGISARRVWNLVAIERESWRTSRLLHAAWKEGRVTTLQATALLPVMSERNARAWIERAGEVTLRRLNDEVAWALDHGQAPPFRDGNEAPPPPGADLRADGLADVTDEEVQKRAHGPAPHSSFGVPGAVRTDFVLPLSVAVMLEETPDLFQRRGEGRWHAFERMIALALIEWTSVPRHPDPVFERDGWRCAVPGCSSRRNLQDHHVVFRSHGGGNGLGNRITVCAAHHLHGIHSGVVRVEGVAPDGLCWELGCTGGKEPLLRFLGDRLLDLDPPRPVVILTG